MISSVNVITARAETTQEKIDRLKQQQKEYDKKIEAASSQIESIKDDIEKQEEYASTLYAQMSDFQSQINNLNDQISAYQEQIDELQAQINEKEKQIQLLDDEIVSIEDEIEKCKREINDTKVALKERLRALYVNGETSEIEVLLSADSLSSFLIRLEMMSNSTKKTTSLVADIQNLALKLENDIAELDKKVIELENAKLAVQEEKDVLKVSQDEIKASRDVEKAKQGEINKKWEAVQQIINNLDTQKQSYKDAISKFNADKANFEKEIQRLVAATASTGSGKVSSKGFVFPMERWSGIYMSSGYGNRSGGFHGGIDFAARDGTAYGRDIYAADAGTVIISTYHYSYGYYIVIDHGDGVTTYYAHASKLMVSKGQTVTRGQKIAEVGSTGNSTGAHLHFEVHINNARTNPSAYVSL